MNQVLLTKQIRSDRIWDVLGILVAFALAATAATVSSQEQNPLARIVLLLVSAFLFALAIRGIFFYFQRFSYTFAVGTETITWGWIHKPKKQKNIQVEDIVEVNWLEEKDDARIRLHLKSGDQIHLPLHHVSVPKEELREVFNQHFPQIKSID